MKLIQLNIQLFASSKSTNITEYNVNNVNNFSSLQIGIYFSANNSSTYFNSRTLYCTCNGITQTQTVSHSIGGSVSATFYFENISHETDGSKNVSWSWSCATGTSALGTISDSGTYTMAKIPRQSQFNLSNWNYGERPVEDATTIRITKYVSSYYNVLTVGPLFNGIYVERYGIEDGYSFKFTDDELQYIIYPFFATTAKQKINFKLRTYTDSSATTDVGIASDNPYYMATIINANPVFSNFEYEDTNSKTITLTNNNKSIIKTCSNLKAIVSTTNKATAQKGATMSKYRLAVGDKQVDVNYNEIHENQDLIVGKDLSNTTLIMNFPEPNITNSAISSGTKIIDCGNGNYISFYKTTATAEIERVEVYYKNSLLIYLYNMEGFGVLTNLSEFNLPEDFGIIQSINNSSTALDYIKFRKNLYLEAIDSNVFTMYAIDSRGNSAMKQISPSIYLAYFKPYFISPLPTAIRETPTSQHSILSFNGTFFNQNFGSITNDLTVSYKFKKTSDSTWVVGTTPITLTKTENNFNFSNEIAGDLGANGFDTKYSYDIELTITDKLSSVSYDLLLRTGKPNIDIYQYNGQQGVAINAPYNETLGGNLQINGTNAALQPYPVGTIYENATDSTSPATLFGGTWVQLTDRFLIGAGNSYAIGATGGSTLLQSHSHTGNTNTTGGHTHNMGAVRQYANGNGNNPWIANGSAWYGNEGMNVTWSGDHYHSFTTNSTGGGNSENMPPWRAIYMWYRSA